MCSPRDHLRNVSGLLPGSPSDRDGQRDLEHQRRAEIEVSVRCHLGDGGVPAARRGRWGDIDKIASTRQHYYIK